MLKIRHIYKRDDKLSDIVDIRKFILLFLTFALFFLGVGSGIGYYWVAKAFRGQIIANSRGETLGKFLSKKEKKPISNVYHKKTEVIKDIDNYSWSVPTVVSPFVGYGCRPGQHNNAYINSMQFRANQELIMPKPVNTYRIFLTGGSTAFSSGAPSQDRTIAAFLSQIINEGLSTSMNMTYEVFTMATPAWASTHERIIIENRLSEFEPDVVISFSGNNDVHWGAEGRNIFWFRSYADEFYYQLLNKAYTISMFKEMHDVVQIQSEKVSPSFVADRLEKNIKLSAYALSLHKIPYIFCLQPTLAVTKKPLTQFEARPIKKRSDRKEYFRQCYEEIDKHLSKLQLANFTYINLSNIFDERSDNEDLFLDSYHFGDKGNEIIAGQMYRQIKPIIVSSKQFSARQQ
jgi:hypothetical protein